MAKVDADPRICRMSQWQHFNHPQAARDAVGCVSPWTSRCDGPKALLNFSRQSSLGGFLSLSSLLTSGAHTLSPVMRKGLESSKEQEQRGGDHYAGQCS